MVLHSHGWGGSRTKDPPIVLKGFAEAAATGNVPAYLFDFLDKNGPEWHVRNGRTLDIPVLFGQGETDNLFPLDQGLKNFTRTPGSDRGSSERSG